MAQLDARPTGDKDVAGSTPAGSATIFYGHSLPFADSSRAVSSDRMCTILVNRLED